MAVGYLKKTHAELTIQDCFENSGTSVVILKAERDEAGKEILFYQNGKIIITNDVGDIVGYE